MKVKAIDIETHEEKDISKYGPGSHRHYLEGEDSEILGIAISDENGDRYLPANKATFEWLRDVQNDFLWVGHNILYDLSWLYYEGFRPRHVADTMGLVRMLDEERLQYSLDACAKDYLGTRKGEDKIQAWCDEHGLKGKAQTHLMVVPESLVAEYAKKDTHLTLKLYYTLVGDIEDQGLDRVWEIEKALLPILADSHHRGIRVDEARRQEVSDMLAQEIDDLYAWMRDKAGCEFNTNSGKQLAPIFDKLGLEYKVTQKGNPSFKGEDLLPFGVDEDMEYFPHVLVVHNKLNKLRRDFVDRLEDFVVGGRVRPMVNPYGTRTGRPSCKTPNIFQIPKRGRGKEICRVLFLPEEGEDWCSMDYSSEEYRVFAHYAVGHGSDRYRERYCSDPDYDMHTENANLAGVDRTKAKTIGLGVLFGMGDKKMAANLGLPAAQGATVVQKFHRVNPAFRATSQHVERVAKRRGYIHTLLGRRRRLNADTAYRGLNFLTQGNSADLAKLTIVEAARRGLLEKVGFLLWLYDEYDLSVAPENRKYAEEFRQIGESILEFRVPMYLDVEYGPNWGEVK